MTHRLSLLVATHNHGKLAELQALLAQAPVDVIPMSVALPGTPQAVEDGETFVENALLKARAAASAAMMVTLAEDAGLEVDALGGRPGVRSARFAREGATDAENNATLLKALEDVEDEHRTARFRCVMVLLDPWGEGSAREIVVEGRCEGSIAREPRGGGGFGYDPLFVLAGTGRTMAEIGEDDKNRVSHRAGALKALLPALLDLVDRRMASAVRIEQASLSR